MSNALVFFFNAFAAALNFGLYVKEAQWWSLSAGILSGSLALWCLIEKANER